MTNPVLNVRVQSHAHKTKGVGTLNQQMEGAYTAELFAKLDATAGGDREVVAAVAGYKIRVLSYGLSCVTAGVATAVFKSATTAISPTYSLAANGNAAESDNNGLFETVAGEALNLTPATNTVGVRVTYILVT